MYQIPTHEQRIAELEQNVEDLAHLLELVVDKLRTTDPIFAKLVIEQNGARHGRYRD